jgi:tetratricopeptide (TPR) repeat protein
MKALEKDRTRRFESASGLALDVQRFLKNEPIEARPPSGLYRFQKLVRRNKTAFCAAAAVVVALVLGLGLSLYLFIKEREALHRAVAAERRQAELREQAVKGLALERQQREMAPITEKFTTAGRLLSQGKMEEAEQVISDIPPNIRQGSIFYNALDEVYGRQGKWAGAIRNFNRSVTADPTNHYAYQYLAPLLVQTGDLEAYWTVCERALSQFEGTADPAVAEQIAKDCLILPPPAGSLERLAKMADIAVAAGPTNPSWPSYMFVKGLAEYRQGHFAGALEWMRKVAAQEGVPARTAQAYATMALAEYQLGQTNAARTALAQGLKIPESELANPGRLDWNDAIIAHSLLREAQRLIMRPPNPGETAK